MIRPVLSKSEKAWSHQVRAYALAYAQARRQNKYEYVAYGRPRCLVTARSLRHADACGSSLCCNLRAGHLGLDLGQRLPKLGRKDFCSRDPARVRSGNIFSKGVVLPSVKLFSACLWSQRYAWNFERWLKEILVLGRVHSTGLDRGKHEQRTLHS